MNIINAVKGVFGATAPWIIGKAKANPTLIRLLQDWKIDQTRHPEGNFEVIYACALVVYLDDRSKSDVLIEIFSRSEIKAAFEEGFYDNNYDVALKKIKEVVDWREQDWNTLGEEIRKLNIDIQQILSEFKDCFERMVKLSATPIDSLINSNIEELQKVQKLDSLKLDTLLETVIKLNESLTKFDNNKLKNFSPFPDEFKSLIEDKIKSFCGRKFVFSAFEKFQEKYSKGYFTVVGDAGMGKSAIAAKYVFEKHFPCYFNIIAQGRNRPEDFLESICQQLMNRYNLQDGDLPTLLAKISQQLSGDKKLVIVVDALDEVEQEAGAENILHLPETLPERVYFILTRRPYNIEKKRLRVLCSCEELDLTQAIYQDLSHDDVKAYISLFINNDSEHQEALSKWIANRNITESNFIEQVAAKSENNFMYLRYVLPGIARGLYDDLSLKQLPDGLQDYYQQHWVRMGMDDTPQEIKVIILFILVEIGTPIPCTMIADICQQDRYDVQCVLDEWVEYLKDQIIDEDICYSFYHASFFEFLKAKGALDSKRKIFQEVNQRIVDYWLRVNGENS